MLLLKYLLLYVERMLSLTPWACTLTAVSNEILLLSPLGLHVIGLPLAFVLFFIIPICVLFFILLDLVDPFRSIYFLPSYLHSIFISKYFIHFILVKVSYFYNFLYQYPSLKDFCKSSFPKCFLFFFFLNVLIYIYTYLTFKRTGIQSFVLMFVLIQSACSFGHEMFFVQNSNFSCAL